MLCHVLACDYDGTIAEHGRLSETTAAALARVRTSGRKLVLVTGRRLDDLRRVCPDVDSTFDAVVTENGAEIYFPSRRQGHVIGEPPTPALLDALQRRGVEFRVGGSIVESRAVFAEAALEAIRETGVERTVVFNRDSMMLLPGGITKASGLEAALSAMELSRHNVVAIGDAENDHAFLSVCECAAAVADAVPALRDRADHVTRAPGPAGVVEFIGEHVLNDLVGIIPGIARHHLPLGETETGASVTLPAHKTVLLIVGPTATGKSTLTGVLVERLASAGRSICLLDPEGDYETLAELEGVVVLGGKGEHALPTPEELEQLLRHPRAGVVLNLSAMSMAEKVGYATKVLPTISAVRAASGMPHWLIVDEAHHLFPADGSSAAEWLRPGVEPVCLITLGIEDLAKEARPLVTAIASTELAAFEAALGVVTKERGADAAIGLTTHDPLERGEAALWIARPAAPEPRAVRFRVARRQVAHRRHVRKYVEGELPPERSFYFRGPEGALNLRAVNLVRFCELAEGVDEATWAHHLRRGEYSEWIEKMIKDPELAREAAAVERNTALSPAESRAALLEAIRRRYAV
jgi:hydroxymethylpyrimidine pyrophosphatase-like HAD family hydrolase